MEKTNTKRCAKVDPVAFGMTQVTKSAAQRLRALMHGSGFTVGKTKRAIKTGYSVSLPLFTRSRKIREEHLSWVWPTLGWAFQARDTVERLFLLDYHFRNGQGKPVFREIAIGAWRDMETQRFEIGLSMIFDNKTEALCHARAMGERYVGDLAAYAAGRDGAIPVEVLDAR